jgi:hypothetical protein
MLSTATMGGSGKVQSRQEMQQGGNPRTTGRITVDPLRVDAGKVTSGKLKFLVEGFLLKDAEEVEAVAL